MKKEFKRRNRTFQLIVIVGCGFFSSFIYVPLFITEDFLSQSLTYRSISIIILTSIMILLLSSLFDLFKKITLNNKGISIIKLLLKQEIGWLEITEFRKQHKGFGQWAGYKYILRYEKNGEKEIEIADNNIESHQELISSIFKLATNARFIEIRNGSSIPFAKELNITDWKNNSAPPSTISRGVD